MLRIEREELEEDESRLERQDQRNRRVQKSISILLVCKKRAVLDFISYFEETDDFDCTSSQMSTRLNKSDFGCIVTLNEINILDTYKDDPFDICDSDLNSAVEKLTSRYGVSYDNVSLYRGMSQSEFSKILKLASKSVAVGSKKFRFKRSKSFTSDKDQAQIYLKSGGGSIGSFADFLGKSRDFEEQVMTLNSGSKKKILDVDGVFLAREAARHVCGKSRVEDALKLFNDTNECEVIVPSCLPVSVVDLEKREFSL